jgi:SanA protein
MGTNIYYRWHRLILKGGRIAHVTLKLMKFVKHIVKLLILLGCIGLFLPRILTYIHAQSRLFTIHNSPNKRVAIVFGAGLRHDGTPTRVLRDRVETAAELYFSGKVEKLLLSGDNRFIEYNEPGAMLDYAIQLGIPEDALVLDYAGRSTYDTCYRAHHIFNIKDALLVTQQFHLPRALYTCSALGIDAVGVSADRNIYRQVTRALWNIRELPATMNAMIEIHILRPLPVLGKPEFIYPVEAQ